MRYWDASALVSLCVDEPATKAARAAARHEAMATWCLSPVEIASAIERKAREGALSADGRTQALRALSELGRSWTEISAMELVRERATRLLASHSLRAADSLQLAAALVAVGDRPSAHQFVCADNRLSDAARREGFDVLSIGAS